MIEYAIKVANDSAAVDEADIEALAAAGFSQDEIWDIGAISAFFAMSNRLANAAGMMPNPEFYTLGRG